jgi:hypothetical protein
VWTGEKQIDAALDEITPLADQALAKNKWRREEGANRHSPFLTIPRKRPCGLD